MGEISHLAADPTAWNYDGTAAPRGVKLSLLTKGRIQVVGVWTDDGAYIAWAPLLKRNKELEEQLGL